MMVALGNWIGAADANEPPKKKRRQGNESHIAKVNTCNIPQEYLLERFVGTIAMFDESWNISNPACDWLGLTCDEQGIVKKIEWESLGPMPTEELCTTLMVDLLPGSLTTLTLVESGFAGNVDFGSLPPQLEVLKLSYNAFNGTADLENAPQTLQEVILDENLFRNCPNWTSLPTSLIYLSIQGNQLRGELQLQMLPPKLVTLALSGNRLSGDLDLNHLPATMEEVYLSLNMFDGFAVLDSLPVGLKELTLNDNTELSGKVDRADLPDDIFWLHGNTKIAVKDGDKYTIGKSSINSRIQRPM